MTFINMVIEFPSVWREALADWRTSDDLYRADQAYEAINDPLRVYAPVPLPETEIRRALRDALEGKRPVQKVKR